MGEDCRQEQEIHSTKHVLDMLPIFVMCTCFQHYSASDLKTCALSFCRHYSWIVWAYYCSML